MVASHKSKGLVKHKLTAYCYDKKGRLIASATNSYGKSHPIQAHFAQLAGKPEVIFLHAEIAAILRCYDRPIHKIRIERYTKDGKPACAKPCAICNKAINAWGIKYVEHT